MAIIGTNGPTKAPPLSVPVETQTTETKRTEVVTPGTVKQTATAKVVSDSIKVGEGKTQAAPVQQQAIALTDVTTLLKAIAATPLGDKPVATAAPAYVIAVMAPIIAPMPLSGADFKIFQDMAEAIRNGKLSLPSELESAVLDLAKLSAAQLDSLMKDGAAPDDMVKKLKAELKAINIDPKDLVKSSTRAAVALDQKAMDALRKLFPGVDDKTLRGLARLGKPALHMLALSYRTNLQASQASKTTATREPAKTITAGDSVESADDDLITLVGSLPITLPRHDETAERNMDGLIGRMMASGDCDIEMLAQLVMMQIAGSQRDEVKEQLADMQKTQKKKDAISAFINAGKKQRADLRTLMTTDYDHRTRLPIDDPLFIDSEKVSLEDFLARRQMTVDGSFQSSDGEGTPPDNVTLSLSPNQPLFPVELTDLRGRPFSFDDAAMAEKLSISVEDLLDLRNAYTTTSQIHSKFPSFEEYALASPANGGAGLTSPASESQAVQVADALEAAIALAPPAPTPAPGQSAPVDAAAPVTATPSTNDMNSIREAATKFGLPLTEILRMFDAFKTTKSSKPFDKFLSEDVKLLTPAQIDAAYVKQYNSDKGLALAAELLKRNYAAEYKSFDQWKKDKNITLAGENSKAIKAYFASATGGVAGDLDPRKMSSESYDIKEGLDDESYTGDGGKDWAKLSGNQEDSSADIEKWAKDVGIGGLMPELNDQLVDIMIAMLAKGALAGRLHGEKLQAQPPDIDELFRSLVETCKRLGGGDLNKTRALGEYVTLRMAEFKRDLRAGAADDGGWGNAAEFSSKFITANADKIDVPGFGIKKDPYYELEYGLKLQWNNDEGNPHDDNMKFSDYSATSARVGEMFTSTNTSVDGAANSSFAGSKLDVRAFMDALLTPMINASTQSNEELALEAIQKKNYSGDPRLEGQPLARAVIGTLIGIINSGKPLVAMELVTRQQSGTPAPVGAPSGNGARAASSSQQASLASLREPRVGSEPPAEVTGLRQMSLAQLDAALEEWEGKKESISAVSEQIQLKLQMMMDRLQQAQSMLSNIMKKISDTSAGIVGNMK